MNREMQWTTFAFFVSTCKIYNSLLFSRFSSNEARTFVNVMRWFWIYYDLLDIVIKYYYSLDLLHYHCKYSLMSQFLFIYFLYFSIYEMFFFIDISQNDMQSLPSVLSVKSQICFWNFVFIRAHDRCVYFSGSVDTKNRIAFRLFITQRTNTSMFSVEWCQTIFWSIVTVNAKIKNLLFADFT